MNGFEPYHHHHHPHFLLHSSLAGSKKSIGLTAQALLFHSSAKNLYYIGMYSVLLPSA
jgi:hypothetical protein